jgi:hypothetical protein
MNVRLGWNLPGKTLVYKKSENSYHEKVIGLTPESKFGRFS